MSLSASTLDDNPLVPRRPAHDEAKFDITAMIDLVFMMNIFFLVTSVTAALAEMDLPAAKHCALSDRDTSILITMQAANEQKPFRVYLGEAGEGKPLGEGEAEERAVRDGVEAAVPAYRKPARIKSEKSGKMCDSSRIGAIAVGVPGI